MLLLIGAVAWWYRDPIVHAASRWLGPRRTALPPVADTAVGAPTPRALTSGRSKVAELARPGGPDSVVLTPNEMASLIGSGIDWTVRRGFDSLRVELLDGTFAVHARLETRVLPRDALGPFAGMLAWIAVALAGAAGFVHARERIPMIAWFALTGFALSQVAAAHLTDGLLLGGTVLAVYTVDKFASSAQVCTTRKGQPSPTK